MILQTKRQEAVPGVPSIEDLYAYYRHKLIHFFTGRGLEREVAEDLCQEVFFRFLRSSKPLENEDHARNLLFRIAQNLLIDHFRKHNGNVRERALSSDDLAEEEYPCLMAEESGPEDILVSDETSQDINSVVSRLPLRYAQAIVLKEYEGYSYREIAAHMGVSEKAVESLLHRARSQLKEELAEAGRRRGGWWSGILIGLRSMRDRVIVKPLRHGLSLGLGSAGAAKGVASLITAIILIGSVVGAGVVATIASHRDVPSAVPAVEGTNPLAVEGEVLEANEGATALRGAAGANGEGDRSSIEDVVRTGPSGGVPEAPVTVVSLVAGTTDTARNVIVQAGAGVDALLAGVGGIIGILTAPITGALRFVGISPTVINSLVELVCLETTRDAAAGLVDAAVQATHVLDETVSTLSTLPLLETVTTAPLPSVLGGGQETSEPPSQTGSGDSAAGAAPAASDTDAQEAGSEQPVEEDASAIPGPIGEVVELLVDITGAVGKLLPF